MSPSIGLSQVIYDKVDKIIVKVITSNLNLLSVYAAVRNIVRPLLVPYLHWFWLVSCFRIARYDRSLRLLMLSQFHVFMAKSRLILVMYLSSRIVLDSVSLRKYYCAMFTGLYYEHLLIMTNKLYANLHIQQFRH